MPLCLACLPQGVKPLSNSGHSKQKEPPVRAAETCGDTRKYTTAHAFPGGGRFAWLPGTSANAGVPDHFAPLPGGKFLLGRQSARLRPGGSVKFNTDATCQKSQYDEGDIDHDCPEAIRMPAVV